MSFVNERACIEVNAIVCSTNKLQQRQRTKQKANAKKTHLLLCLHFFFALCVSINNNKNWGKQLKLSLFSLLNTHVCINICTYIHVDITISFKHTLTPCKSIFSPSSSYKWRTQTETSARNSSLSYGKQDIPFTPFIPFHLLCFISLMSPYSLHSILSLFTF